jgi:hypothetical protein
MTAMQECALDAALRRAVGGRGRPACAGCYFLRGSSAGLT